MREAESFAHGRVNLIGEHTDYNGGWVLPTAIPQRTRVRLFSAEGRRAELRAPAEHEGGVPRQGGYTLGEEIPGKGWLDYFQGATKLLAAGGATLGGFRAEVESDVPEGSGLSSSAALELAFLKALRELFSLNLDDIALARLGQRIENEFVGARVGIMDQMACALAKVGEALFLDTESLEFQSVPLPMDRADLLVINSGVRHSLSAGGGYNERRSQCEEACARLGVASLRELHPQGLSKVEALPDLLKRRARHVITENLRVHEAVAALKAKDLARVGELFYASHASMRDDYEVSVPEIDLLVSLCQKQKGVYGARLTGGGFGGSIVALTEKGRGRAVGEVVAEEYKGQTGVKAQVLVPGRNA